MGYPIQRIAKHFEALGLVVVLILMAAAGESFGQVPSTSGKSAVTAPTEAIPIAEIATKSTEVTNLVAFYTTKFTSSPDIDKIRQPFQIASDEIEREYFDTVTALRGQPTQARLQGQQGLWKSRQLQISTWLNLLTERAVELREASDRLVGLKESWSRARETAAASLAPTATLQQIDAVLNAIDASQAPMRAHLDDLLGFQGRVSAALTRCDDILMNIAQAQKRVVAGILTPERPPVWSGDWWEHLVISSSDRIREIRSNFRTELSQYGRDPSRELPIHIGLFIVSIGLFSAVRRFRSRWAEDSEKAASLLSVFERPFVAALFTVWIFATRFNSPTPPIIQNLFSLLALIPILWLIQPAVAPPMLPGVYALCGLYGIDIVREVFSSGAVIEQLVLLLEGLAGIGVFYWMLASRHLQHAAANLTSAGRTKAVVILCKTAPVYLGAGVVATAFGYVDLGRIIISGSISAIQLAIALYAGVRMFNGVVAVALQIWPLRLLQMVRQYRHRIENRAHRLLVWLAAFAWTWRLLDHIGLMEPIISMGSTVLGMKLERGTISLSIADILAFGLTIWVSYLVSNFIRFALKEEVYSRTHTASGTAYASSRLLHYSILAIGFVVGLGVLGMDLSKVSILAGAFGVGIGFGLQSVVNNFVCGLILLFERPIHVGDTIEVGELLGEVRRIGFRASMVRTYQGSDIIVPNSQFISANVTNWTFSDRLRRIELPVGVNYASAPKRVIELLEEVARSNSQVLKYPSPQCFFVGYGDSSINFELRAWTDQFDDYTKIRSDLNSAIYDAVMAAGMSFPFPQREVRLVGDFKADSK